MVRKNNLVTFFEAMQRGWNWVSCEVDGKEISIDVQIRGSFMVKDSSGSRIIPSVPSRILWERIWRKNGD